MSSRASWKTGWNFAPSQHCAITVCRLNSEDPAHAEPRFGKRHAPAGHRARHHERGRRLPSPITTRSWESGRRRMKKTIERVYRTLAGRFHPDNPSTGDAKTFLRIREAYDTLSDPARRAQYNALRQRTKYSERFRLRGREFFDGIKGEQLRRLAVLCLLYRQAASEVAGTYGSRSGAVDRMYARRTRFRPVVPA